EFRVAGDVDRARTHLSRLGTVEDVSVGRVPNSLFATLDVGTLPTTVGGLVAAGSQLVGVRRVDEDLDAIYRRYFEKREEVSA
ncbi:MAG TPA: hypothetical protein VF115_07220, partial [Acidimicrobiia bacterium]